MKKLKGISYLTLSLVLITISCEKKEVIVNSQPTQTSVTDTTNINDSTQVVKTTTQETSNTKNPAVVTNFVNKYFPNIPVATTEIKSSPLEGKSYEIKLNDGAEIELNEKGEWTEIKDIKGIPSGIIPSSIATYLKNNYNGIVVEKIEKEKNSYKVELINNIDLKFDSNGKFLKVD